MGQWGAQGYAQQGYTYDQILAAYYPGTTLGQTSARLDPRPAREREEAADHLVEEADHGRGRRRRRPHAARRAVRRSRRRSSSRSTAGRRRRSIRRSRSRRRPGRRSRSAAATGAGSSSTCRARSSARSTSCGLAAVPLRRRAGGDAVRLAPGRAPGAGRRRALVRAREPEGRRAVRRLRRTGVSQAYLGVSAETPAGKQAVNATAGEVLLYNGDVARHALLLQHRRLDAVGGRRVRLPGPAVSRLGARSLRLDLPVPRLGTGAGDREDAREARSAWWAASSTRRSSATRRAARRRSRSRRSRAARSSRPPLGGATVASALGLRSTWFSVGVLSLQPPVAESCGRTPARG